VDQQEPSKRRDFVLARAKRYQAEICRLQNQQLGVANTLCSDALAAIAPHAPLTSRDLLEEAEINELQGCVRFGLNFNNAADQSLSDAQSCYQRITDAFEEEHRHRTKRVIRWFKRLFVDDGSEEILRRAGEGAERVAAARQNGVCGV